MKRRWLLITYLLILLAGLIGANQWVGYRLSFPRALGGLHVDGMVFYSPWAFFDWSRRYGTVIPRALQEGEAILISTLIAATLALAALRGAKRMKVLPIGQEKWATIGDLRAAGLVTGRGTVVGQWHGTRRPLVLTYDGPEHQLVSGASRSGKGVGHVIPTLLQWPGSVLAYDVKGELWQTTAGFRSSFGRCLRFNPTHLESARFNPLWEIRKGTHEIRDAQNVAEMLVNPTGAKTTLDIWDQQASQLLVALILHVLYTEPDHQKHLGMVRHRLLDFFETCHAMATVNHRLNAQTKEPETHPEILLVARELLSQPEKFQASVRGTASSYLTLWADELVTRNTSVSDFRLGDLMCQPRPLTLYLQPPPSDAPRLRPLIRLIINQACRALMEELDKDNSARRKHHRLLLMLDEFPTLGRLDFFTVNLRQMAGYGIKSHLIVQSFNDIVEAYGPHNTIIDNCHLLVAFASADTGTCQRISQMTGTVTEYRESYSGPKQLWQPGHRTLSQSEQVRPLLSPGDVRELSDDQQLIFITGHKPIRCRKLRYYQEEIFKTRLLPPPGQDRMLRASNFAIPWVGERAKPPLPRSAPPLRVAGNMTANSSQTEATTQTSENSAKPEGPSSSLEPEHLTDV